MADARAARQAVGALSLGIGRRGRDAHSNNEKREQALVASAARRRFLLLFDKSFTDLPGLDRSRRAARDFVRLKLTPTDLAAVAGSDLVVAADGANSTVRGLLQEDFGPSLDVRPNFLAWYGTPRRFDPLSLVFRQNADGLLIAHAYTYSPTLSTFLVETDPDTFARSGLGAMSEADSLRYCERVFAEDLAGEPLRSNKSQWFRYAIVRNRSWHRGNVVLLGDALRTGHPSIGSGTRLAMQDSIALFRAFERCGADVPASLAEFERARRPGSDDLRAAAVKSTEWYETVRMKLDLAPVAFAYDYMRRTGRVSHEDLRTRDPALVARYEALRGARAG